MTTKEQNLLDVLEDGSLVNLLGTLRDGFEDMKFTDDLKATVQGALDAIDKAKEDNTLASLDLDLHSIVCAVEDPLDCLRAYVYEEQDKLDECENAFESLTVLDSQYEAD